MKNRRLYLGSFIVIFTAMFGIAFSASAMEGNINLSGSQKIAPTNALPTINPSILRTQPLIGLEVEEPTKIPSTFDMIVTDVVHTVKDIITFDPVKEATNDVILAQEKLLTAEFIAENSTNERDLNKIETLVDSANDHLNTVESNQEKIIDNPTALDTALLENILIVESNTQVIIDKVESVVPETDVPLITKLSEEAELRKERLNQSFQDTVNIDRMNYFLHDKDRDGIADSAEAEFGTSDFEYDSDGDGLSDTDEIEIWGTDPSSKDTDGDGYADGWEVIKGFNPAGEGRIE